MSIVVFRIYIDWRSSQMDAAALFSEPQFLPLEIIAADSAIATVQHNRRRQREKTSSGVLTLFSPLPGCQSGLCHRQMLAHRIPAEAKLQPYLNVGAALGVELLSTPEVVVREASLAAGWLLGLAADSLHRGSGCAELAVLDSGATSPTMRRLWKASRGFQLFVSSLLKRTWQQVTLYHTKQRLSSLNTLRAIQAHL